MHRVREPNMSERHRAGQHMMLKETSLLLVAACMLGAARLGKVAAQEDVVEEFDCDRYLATAPVKTTANIDEDQPYLTLDTNEVKTWNLGTSITEGFTCGEQLLVEVTGSQELTIISTADSAVMSNARFEVRDSSKLILDIPHLTITGVVDSRVYGAVFVEEGSSMDVLHQTTFSGNSLDILLIGSGRELEDWDPRGGAALYSEGDVKFHEKAYFLGNSQYSQGDAFDMQNLPGGAVANRGTMEFMKKATFNDNSNPQGGNGGGIANSGTLTFNRRAIFRRNTVKETTLEGESIVGGRGAAVFNGGSDTADILFERAGDSTIVFKRKAIFKDNVGALGGGALASRGEAGDNKITFEDTANFKDNRCGDHPAIVEYLNPDNIDTIDENKGGGAILAYGPTTVEFQKTANFKRNEAPNGGAVRTGTGATISFSEDELITEDNTASATCPDILVNEGSSVLIAGETIAGEDLCDRS